MISFFAIASLLSIAPIDDIGGAKDRDWSITGDLRFQCTAKNLPNDLFYIQIFGNKKNGTLVISRNRFVGKNFERNSLYFHSIRSQTDSLKDNPNLVKISFLGKGVKFVEGSEADVDEQFSFSFFWQDGAIFSDISEEPTLTVSSKKSRFGMSCFYDNSQNLRLPEK